MPVRSQQQREFLNWRFGHDWVRQHGFDQSGKLPQYVHHQQGSANIGGNLYRQKLAAATKLGGAPGDAAKHPKVTYHADHLVGCLVPKGGSCCAKCTFLGKDGASCENSSFIKWNNGDKRLPHPADMYCCDFWNPVHGEAQP